jgi:hypothetical protein
VYKGLSTTTNREKSKPQQTTCQNTVNNYNQPEPHEQTKPKNHQPTQPHKEVVTHENKPQQQLNKKQNRQHQKNYDKLKIIGRTVMLTNPFKFRKNRA